MTTSHGQELGYVVVDCFGVSSPVSRELAERNVADRRQWWPETNPRLAVVTLVDDPTPTPELFPGTTAALAGLSIRPKEGNA